MANGIKNAPYLGSGRSGCDAQMHALSMAIGQAYERSRPAVVLCTGHERVDEAITLARQLEVPAIGMGNPGTRSRDLDLVVTTPQFHIEGENVVTLPYAITPYGAHTGGAQRISALTMLPRPVGLMLVGASVPGWKLERECLENGLWRMRQTCRTVVVLTSRRTTGETRRNLEGHVCAFMFVNRIGEAPIRIEDAITIADEVRITGDSVSMISEAIQADRRIAIIPLTRTVFNRDAARGPLPGDLEAFWNTLASYGPIAEPAFRWDQRSALDIAMGAVAMMMDKRETGIRHAA